jgi:pyruvate dehydrogenase E2 component (dihydrolipoamide acetyltransferase)
MPKEVVLPELAESVVEGEILRWLVNEGEALRKDQPFVEVMTDKVTVELPSPYEGVLLQKLAKEGDVIPVHAPIALIAEPGEVATPIGEKPEAAPSLQAQEERSIVEPGQVAEDDGANLSLFKPDNKQEQVKKPLYQNRTTKHRRSPAPRAGDCGTGGPQAGPGAGAGHRPDTRLGAQRAGAGGGREGLR